MNKLSMIEHARGQVVLWQRAADNCLGTLYKATAQDKANNWRTVVIVLQHVEDHKTP